jgi:CHAT domain-containing protein
MNPDDLVQQIFDAPDRTALFQRIEAASLNATQQEEMLYTLRDRVGVGSSDAYDERVWRVLFASAHTTPLPFAIAMHIYGRRCLLRGDYQGSIEPLRIAVEAYRWAGDEDGEGRAKAQLANALFSDGQYDEALSMARAALQIFARAEFDVGVSKCLNTIGAIYADTHQSKDAIEAYRAAIAVFDPEDTSSVALETIAGALIDIAWVAQEQLDQLEEAQQALAQAEPLLEHLRQLPGANYWRQHFTFNLQHALIALRLGHHATARRYLGQAESYLSKDTITDQFQIDLWRGYQALLLGDTPSATRLLQKATQQSESRESVKCKADASLFAALLPDLPIEAALRLLEDAERIYCSLDIMLAPAMIATEKARLTYRAGDIAQARVFLSQARLMCEAYNLPRRILEVDLIRATYDPDMTVDELRHLAGQFAATPDYISQAIVWTILGERLEHAGQPHVARDAYERAITATIAVRGVVRSSVHTAQVLLAHRWSYERAFALTAEDDPMRAHELSERMRAQVLLDEVVNDRLPELLGEDDQPLSHLRKLRLRLDMGAARASLLSTNTTQASNRSATEEVYDELREAQLAFMQALQDAEVQRAGAQDWVLGQVEDANAVQAALDDTTAVVSYFRVRRLDSRKSDLWVVVLTSHGAPLVQSITRHEDLDPFLKMWGEQREAAFNSRAAGSQPIAEGLLEILFTTFLAPIWSDLAPYQRLVIIPDETLPLVPLHAARLDSGAYVLMSHTVSYAPSASFLLYCLRREATRDLAGGALICGWEGSGKQKLRYVQHELRALEQPLKTTSRHGVLSADEVLAAMRDVRFIHISCHGSFPEHAHPRFARLLLGRDDLFVYDLYAQQLRADLLTLSACDTGRFGVGLQGLFSAGLVAGASTVLTSMWPADDLSTTEIMKQFYTALLDQYEGRAAALRTAQLHCIERITDHPRLWAPFFIVGVPGPLRQESAGSAPAISKV